MNSMTVQFVKITKNGLWFRWKFTVEIVFFWRINFRDNVFKIFIIKTPINQIVLIEIFNQKFFVEFPRVFVQSNIQFFFLVQVQIKFDARHFFESHFAGNFCSLMTSNDYPETFFVCVDNYGINQTESTD